MATNFVVASLIACTVVLVVMVPVVLAASARSQRKWLLWLALCQLPMSAASYYLVRKPLLQPLWRVLIDAFDPRAGRALAAGSTEAVAHSPLLATLATIEAPLSEEIAKIAPLLLVFAWPAAKRRFLADNDRPVPVALSLGVGFGLGEVWLVAALASAGGPEVSAVPWYMLSGFMGERAIVCVLHGLITAVVVRELGKGTGRVVAGLLGAMALHALLNLPAILMRIGAFGIDPGVWVVIAGFWIQVFLIVMLVAVRLMHRGRGGKKRSFIGEVRCPSCKEIYARPIFGVNLPWARYERCPKCGTWQWTRFSDEVDDDDLPSAA